MARELDELDHVLVNTNNSATPSHSKFYLVYLSHNFAIISYVFASTSRILILTFAPAHVVDTPRCAVCRGEPCGSNAQCSCERCSNCGIICAYPLCRRCQDLQECVACRRRLPPGCFSSNGDRCQACTKRQDRPRCRSSANNVVNEVIVPTTVGSESFDSFINRNAALIDGIVDDHRRQHGYASCKIVNLIIIIIIINLLNYFI